MDPLALFSAALKPVDLALSLITQRPRLSISVRHIPEIQSYIIEIVNSGWKPTSITAVGISGMSGHYSTGYNDHTWIANDLFPRRLQDRDCGYFIIWWGPDVKDQDRAAYAWVRDITGKVTTARLPKPLPSTASVERVDIPEADRARLFNLALQKERTQEAASRIAILDVEIDFYRRVAQARLSSETRRRELRERQGED